MTTQKYTHAEMNKKLRSRLPAFPHNYNEETDTITLIPAELKVWKKKLLRVLDEQILIDYELYLPGICGVIDLCVHNSSSRRAALQLDINNNIVYNCTCFLSQNWKHYSGVQSYPILDKTKIPTRHASAQYHVNSTTRWIGRQRKLRISALQCWISHLPAEGLTLKVIHTHG